MSLSLQSICSKVVLFGACMWGFPVWMTLDGRWTTREIKLANVRKDGTGSKKLILRKQYISFYSARSLSPDSAIPYFTLHDCNTFAQVWQSDLKSVLARNPDLETKCSFFPFSLELKEKTTHTSLPTLLTFHPSPLFPPKKQTTSSAETLPPTALKVSTLWHPCWAPSSMFQHPRYHAKDDTPFLALEGNKKYPLSQCAYDVYVYVYVSPSLVLLKLVLCPETRGFNLRVTFGDGTVRIMNSTGMYPIVFSKYLVTRLFGEVLRSENILFRCLEA